MMLYHQVAREDALPRAASRVALNERRVRRSAYKLHAGQGVQPNRTADEYRGLLQFLQASLSEGAQITLTTNDEHGYHMDRGTVTALDTRRPGFRWTNLEGSRWIRVASVVGVGL